MALALENFEKHGLQCDPATPASQPDGATKAAETKAAAEQSHKKCKEKEKAAMPAKSAAPKAEKQSHSKSKGKEKAQPAAPAAKPKAEPKTAIATSIEPPLKKVKQEPNQAAPTAASSTQKASSSTASSSSQQKTVSKEDEKQANIEPDEEDVLSRFGPASEKPKASLQERTKDLYMSSDLLVPGVAVKKMRQAMTADEANAQHFLAILGDHIHCMHKTKRAGVAKMILGDFVKHRQKFWGHVTRHLDKNKIALVLFASEFPQALRKEVA